MVWHLFWRVSACNYLFFRLWIELSAVCLQFYSLEILTWATRVKEKSSQQVSWNGHSHLVFTVSYSFQNDERRANTGPTSVRAQTNSSKNKQPSSSESSEAINDRRSEITGPMSSKMCLCVLLKYFPSSISFCRWSIYMTSLWLDMTRLLIIGQNDRQSASGGIDKWYCTHCYGIAMNGTGQSGDKKSSA